MRLVVAIPAPMYPYVPGLLALQVGLQARITRITGGLMEATKHTPFACVGLFQRETVEHPHVHVVVFDLIDHTICSSPFDSSESLFTLP